MRKTDRQPTAFGLLLLRLMADAGYRNQTALVQACSRFGRVNGPDGLDHPDDVTIGNSTISRYIYDPGRPDYRKLEVLAAALNVDAAELKSAAGYGTGAAETASAMAAVRPMTPLAAELDRILRPGSGVPVEEQAAIREGVDRLLDRARRHLRRRSA